MLEQQKKRRVSVRVYDRAQYLEDKKISKSPIEDWGFSNKYGWHCGYGIEHEEYEKGIGNYTVVIVELDDQSIVTAHPSCVKFV